MGLRRSAADMCGIVGLFLKEPGLEPKLGALTARMLGTMCSRGPDSAGFAVYGAGSAGQVKLTLRGPAATDFTGIADGLREAGCAVALALHDTHAVLRVPADA